MISIQTESSCLDKYASNDLSLVDDHLNHVVPRTIHSGTDSSMRDRMYPSRPHLRSSDTFFDFDLPEHSSYATLELLVHTIKALVSVLRQHLTPKMTWLTLTNV